MKTKVTVSVLVIMVAALLVTGATMALFTSEATVEANVLTAGKLELTTERPPAALVFNVDNIYPGAGYQPGQAADDDEGEMMVTDIENTGSLPFYLKAVISETGASPGANNPGYLPGKTNLFLTLTGPEGEVHYTEATLETLQGTDLVWQVDGAPLVIGPGEVVNFRLFGQFDISAGNAYQESNWEGTVTFTAVQSDGFNNDIITLLSADQAYVVTPADGVRIGSAYGRLEGSYTGSAAKILLPSTMGDYTVKYIYQDVFHGKNLTAVTFAKNSEILQIHARAFRNNKLTGVIFPAGLTRIDLFAFDSNNLQEVVLPAGVQIIEQRAFSNNNISRVTFGGNITIIGNNAFDNNNEGLKEAYAAGGEGTYLFIEGNWVKQ